ncbi:MAG: peptide deformylase [Acidimicrobiales bacterium mtb01]|nr:peptide deformylase [Actinomycetota bacterium]TEX45684.1 MAG: peptide deformylase [Acidimicrobiales bacterium mtb01]
MILPIVLVGDPVLRRPAEEVPESVIGSPYLIEVAHSMVQTMRAAPGAGLAAPQVGLALRMFVVADDDDRVIGSYSEAFLDVLGRRRVEPMTVVNPIVEVIDPTLVELMENCLSMPDHWVAVRRHRSVRLQGTNPLGEPVSFEAHGYAARLIQHELDHLNGVLCIDRGDTRTLMTTDNRLRHWHARLPSDVRAAMTNISTTAMEEA